MGRRTRGSRLRLRARSRSRLHPSLSDRAVLRPEPPALADLVTAQPTTDAVLNAVAREERRPLLALRAHRRRLSGALNLLGSRRLVAWSTRVAQRACSSMLALGCPKHGQRLETHPPQASHREPRMGSAFTRPPPEGEALDVQGQSLDRRLIDLASGNDLPSQSGAGVRSGAPGCPTGRVLRSGKGRD